MVFEEESKEIIVKFIASQSGPVSKQKVIDHMESEEVKPAEFRTSRVTTLNLIKQLESGDRIKILKEGWRQGQSHQLIINDKNEFDEISEELSKLEKVIDRLPDHIEKPPAKPREGFIWAPDIEWAMMNLQLLLVRTSLIPVENDAQMLYKKIIKLMLMITLKQIRARRKQAQGSTSDLSHP